MGRPFSFRYQKLSAEHEDHPGILIRQHQAEQKYPQNNYDKSIDRVKFLEIEHETPLRNLPLCDPVALIW